MQTHASVIHQIGGPEVLSYEAIALPPLAADEILIEQHAIGLNFVDTYFRSGVYPWKFGQPMIIGAEASGVVMARGAAVKDIAIGDRVAYVFPHGAYCQHRIVKAERVVQLPDDISFEIAAAVMVKGLTVEYLLHRTFNVQTGHTILFHAAAGGVGLLAGQWAAKLGATIIGTVSSAEKAALAKANGYNHVINYTTENFVERVLEMTDGKGVDVVYDSVGKDTYPHSLKCIKRLGHWVSFGQSSGMITDFELQHLAQNGSLTATRPSLFNYIVSREELTTAATHLFEVLLDGTVQVAVNQQFKLKEAVEAHRRLEGRATTGSSVLIPL